MNRIQIENLDREREVWARWIAIVIMVVGIGVNVAVMYANRGRETAFSRDRVVPVRHAQCEPPVEVRWVEKIEPGRGRVMAYGVDLDGEEDQVQLGTFNYASVLGYYSIGGYDATLPIKVYEATRRLPNFGATRDEFSEEQVEYLRSWGVRYWVTDDVGAAERMKELYSEFEEVFRGEVVVVLEDSEAMPLVYVDDGVEVEYEFRGGGMEVRGLSKSKSKSKSVEINEMDETDRGGGVSGEREVVFNVIYWPEYKAYGDGVELAVVEREGRPVVEVPEGVEEVKLEYVDEELRKGWWLMGVGVVGWLMIFFSYPFWFRCRR